MLVAVADNRSPPVQRSSTPLQHHCVPGSAKPSPAPRSTTAPPNGRAPRHQWRTIKQPLLAQPRDPPSQGLLVQIYRSRMGGPAPSTPAAPVDCLPCRVSGGGVLSAVTGYLLLQVSGYFRVCPFPHPPLPLPRTLSPTSPNGLGRPTHPPSARAFAVCSFACLMLRSCRCDCCWSCENTLGAQLYKTPKVETGNRVALALFASVTGGLAVARIVGV